MCGIGLFLGFLGLKNAGFIVADPQTFVRLGNLHDPAVLLFFLGFVLIVIFDRYKIPGAILFGILSVSLLGLFFHDSYFHGLFSLPPLYHLYFSNFLFITFYIFNFG